MINKTPLYNLNAVLREVNVTPDVLRAWERRYQLPVPQRTGGGHRLYSDYDIEIIKWLKARQVEGLSISHAVNLWHEISAIRDPLEDLHESSALPAGLSQLLSGAIDSFRENWIKACLAYDTEGAENTLKQASSLFSLESVCVRVIQQGLSEIGKKWHDGSASVQQEHFATAMAHNRLQSLIAGTPNPLFEKTILIGCPPSELHTFPGLLLNLLVRREGFRVVYLGADVPLEQLVETANRIKPNLVVLTAQRLSTARTLAQAAALLTAHKHQVTYGGLIFNSVPEVIKHIPGHFLGASIESSVAQIKELALHPQPAPIAPQLSADLKSLLESYSEHRGLVEHRVNHLLREKSVLIPNLADINTFFGDGLSAALELGNIAFMNNDIRWVEKLHQGLNQSTNLLPVYLRAYQQAVTEEMGPAAAPITTWINRTFTENFFREK